MADWKRMQSERWWLIVLEPGDDVIEALTRFARTTGVGAAHITGIGAVSQAEVGHYSVVSKAYSWRTFTQPLEILSLAGNVALKDGETLVHAHVVAGADDMTVVGGHLKRAVVSATCEIVLHGFEGEIRRMYDDRTGLYPMDVGR